MVLRAIPLLIALVFLLPASAAADPVYVSDVKGAISVAVERQIGRAIETARRHPNAILVIQLDTPGGLVSVTREIIQMINAAPMPVIVYVAPSGARAASAGTFIVYAAHIAAMAPGTNIGAATPIEMGGTPPLPGQRPAEKKEKGESDGAGQRKAVNDVVAFLRSLAQLRGRNVEWAEKAVREAATLTAEEAERERVIEIVAVDLKDLLLRLDGRMVKLAAGERRLVTRDAAPTTIEPDWRTRALSAIADPNVALILLMIGFYGIMFEFWHPGTLAPGVIGAIALIAGLIALSTLPVHYGALALLLLGIALMIAEVLTPGTAVLGIGGVIAFLTGAIFLFEGPDSDMAVAVSLPVALGVTAATAALIFGVAGAALKVRRRPAATGAEQMIGSEARVVAWRGTAGQVRVHGEIWSARAKTALEPDTTVRVTGRDGLTLIVEP